VGRASWLGTSAEVISATAPPDAHIRCWLGRAETVPLPSLGCGRPPRLSAFTLDFSSALLHDGGVTQSRHGGARVRMVGKRSGPREAVRLQGVPVEDRPLTYAKADSTLRWGRGPWPTVRSRQLDESPLALRKARGPPPSLSAGVSSTSAGRVSDVAPAIPVSGRRDVTPLGGSAPWGRTRFGPSSGQLPVRRREEPNLRGASAVPLRTSPDCFLTATLGQPPAPVHLALSRKTGASECFVSDLEWR
jgi:hypothetical protein